MSSSQISEFQEKHRKRLLAFYGEKVNAISTSCDPVTDPTSRGRAEGGHLSRGPSAHCTVPVRHSDAQGQGSLGQFYIGVTSDRGAPQTHRAHFINSDSDERLHGRLKTPAHLPDTHPPSLIGELREGRGRSGKGSFIQGTLAGWDQASWRDRDRQRAKGQGQLPVLGPRPQDTPQGRTSPGCFLTWAGVMSGPQSSLDNSIIPSCFFKN